MADRVEEIRQALRRALAELEKERRRLERALAEMGNSAARPRRRAGGGVGAAVAGANRSARRPRRRAGRGERRAQFLAAVERSPGASAAQIARAIGVSSNQAAALGRGLLGEGAVSRRGSKYHPKAGAAGASKGRKGAARKAGGKGRGRGGRKAG